MKPSNYLSYEWLPHGRGRCGGRVAGSEEQPPAEKIVNRDPGNGKPGSKDYNEDCEAAGPYKNQWSIVNRKREVTKTRLILTRVLINISSPDQRYDHSTD
jgi:hypothetical protein